MPTTSHADRARLAHRALRLRESGFDTERKLADAAREARKFAENPPASHANDIIRALRAGDTAKATELANTKVVVPAVSLPAIGGIAQSILDARDPDAPGLTDRKLVDELMNRDSLTDIWKAWDEASTANIEATHPAADVAAWRKATARSEKAAAERVSEMQETGQFDVHPAFGHLRHTDGAANALYDLARQGFLNKLIDWGTGTGGDDIRVVLVDSADYTVNLATHDFLDDIIAGGRVAVTASLTGKTITAGVADADDTSFTAVSGDPSEALVIYSHTGAADANRRLIAYIDTATGLPVTPNGGNINVAWDSGSNRIFKL